jgi:hypothetical protein
LFELLGDTASVKGIMIECTTVNNPAIHNQLDFVWEKRQGLRCNETSLLSNLAELSPQNVNSSEPLIVNCAFDTWTGIGPNHNLRHVSLAQKAYISMGLNNNWIKWTLLKRLMRKNWKVWFLEKFPENPRLLDEFAAEGSDKKNYTGSLTFTLTKHPIPSNLFRKLRQTGKIKLQHAPTFEQFVGNCGIYQIAFSLFKPSQEFYFDLPVRKRMTRFIFKTLSKNKK